MRWLKVGTQRKNYNEYAEGKRCWVHKTMNILDKMPKSVQPKAKEKIYDMYMARLGGL